MRRVEVTPGFLLMAAWLNYIDDGGILQGILFSCVLHELGHLAALRILDIPVRKIRVTAIGAEICMGQEMSYLGEMLAVFMGPLVNFLLAGLFCRIQGCEMLAGMNLVLGCFNLLPVGKLDGGRALRCILMLTVGQERGERLSHQLSLVIAAVLCAAGWCLLFLGANPTLLLVSLWLLCAVSHNGGKRNK